ncbi:MAG: hypothetical protein AABZ61_01840, partial [Bacteroidota bacterium]
DPVLRVRDFEGYKLYRSTDPDFRDIFTITDATGTPQGYRALAQYDIKDGVTGYFRANPELFEAASGFSFYLGSDNGLQHTYIDRGVENGRRYYYALVAYDRGDATVGIFPSENTKFVSILPTGEILHDINTTVVTPNAKTAGYVSPKGGVRLTPRTQIGTGEVFYNVVDETRLSGHTYRVEFLDTQVDSVDNNNNGKIDAADSTEWTRRTSFYFVRDLENLSETFVSQDTSLVHLGNKNLVASTVTVRNQQGTVIQPSSYRLDATRGEIRGASAGSLPAGNYIITYQYYPVFRSPYIRGTPFVGESKDADIFDGLELVFNNDWGTRLVDSLSGWVGKNAYVFNFSPFNVQLEGRSFLGYTRPSDYEIQFSDRVVDTSYADPDLYPFQTPVNFRVYNKTDSTYIKFIFADTDGNRRLSPLDELVFLEKNPRGKLGYTWDAFFINKPNDKPDTVYNLTTGDKLALKTSKPLRSGDVLEFGTAKPLVVDTLAKKELARVRVVPNPYVTASAHEPPLPPGITSGRGERKIEFIHLPAKSIIHIFTARGEHLITLQHDGNIEDGTVAWNLKSKENLDVAYGIYFYVVESPVGNKTGKIGVIK